ncbi:MULTISPECIES: phenazine biosynthesis protein [unclassified Streptomyces]|uniref:phenazine biosynthesis protein n=1 Tax=unclassified Streptomyces TaxID=2593676 RepID=UPI002DDA3331|nr:MULTISPECIES: phenazine biosynthesis protein [unclassified Streptomyces]WSA91216.1 phenazine biosynthesis protein [Streptomyces sp. NBC_01795]WSS16175.1 phenazine biosynthesis protein [Streptomyces sp. NBC_01186]WSS44994.1 phenazine biosynthesis protein [Streptomyces sp. NBC_01187]
MDADAAADFDSHVRKSLAWHFDPGTGSAFWLGKRQSLGFDPVADIQGADGLVRFPDLSAELRTVPVRDLIPRGLADRHFRVHESGGTTGAPARVVAGEGRLPMLRWAREVLLAGGLPPAGDWLCLGPSGPHIVGADVQRHAAMGGGLCHTVDLDPRWVKRAVTQGRGDLADAYVQHLLDQAETVLESQHIEVLSTTPPLLESLCGRPALLERVRRSVRAIIWSGTSASPETLRQLDEVYFPEARLIGVYGNTLMGLAPQRPPAPGDTHACVFETHPDTTLVEPVDEAGAVVPYGERGRVRLHLVSEEMFLPNVLERDTAVRVRAAPGARRDGLADLRPHREAGARDIVEGVY